MKWAAAITLDGRVAFIVFQLDQSGGFSQAGVLRSLSEKFGSPAQAALPSTYFWTHGKDELVLDEIEGKVTLADTAGMNTLHAIQAKDGSKDL